MASPLMKLLLLLVITFQFSTRNLAGEEAKIEDLPIQETNLEASTIQSWNKSTIVKTIRVYLQKPTIQSRV